MSQSPQEAFLPSHSHNEWCAETVEQWVDCYGDLLYGYAFSRLGNATDAEDLVQKTFLAAFMNLQRGNHVESPREWLCAVLRHNILSHIRTEKYRTPTNYGLPMSDWFDDNEQWKTRNTFYSLAQQEHPLDEQELLKVIHLCLQRIPSNNAIVFQLHVLEEQSLKTIREELNISKAACTTRLYRARLGLSKCVSERWEMEGRLES